MSKQSADYQTVEMQILAHHIYEYKKGLRNLVLITINTDELNKAEKLLVRKGISYFLLEVNVNKVNIFFGNELCIKIIQSFDKKSLSDYTNEEDFMLGTMLGYDCVQQCERYLERKGKGVEN